VLGVPSGLGAVGAGLLVLGFVVVGIAAWYRRAWFPADVLGRSAALCLAITAAAGPYLVWRVVEDLRVTTAMTPYDRSVAGPVQAYLQPYLLDPVARIIPPGASYMTVAGSGVRYGPARDAFGALAMIRLFPRRAVADPAHADWVIAWGTPLTRVANVQRTIVARPAQAGYPPVLVGRVRR